MSHDNRDIDFIREQLQSALPPLEDAELRTDLWPRLLRRMEEPRVSFGWFESVLVALIALAFVMFPQLLPAMLYHL